MKTMKSITFLSVRKNFQNLFDNKFHNFKSFKINKNLKKNFINNNNNKIKMNNYLSQQEEKNLQGFLINKYLMEIKSQFNKFHNNNNNKQIHFILGNKSCDMDSFISVFLLSIFRNFFQEENNNNNNNNPINFLSESNKIFVPIINCKREDFNDRLDIYYLLRKNNIEEKNFIFWDDENLINFFEENCNENSKENNNNINNYKIIIADHNEIENSQKKFLEENLVEIIDHHMDSSNNNKNLIKKSLIYPLGSCSSLVLLENLHLMEKDLENKGNKGDNMESDNQSIFLKFFQEDFLFLLSAILLDTSNFIQKDFNIRWIYLDKLVFEKIKEFNNKYFSKKINDEITLKFYEELSNSKYDQNANLNLGVPKIFNKDRKEFIYSSKYLNSKELKVTWSSLPVNMTSINQKFSERYVKEYIQEKINQNALWVFNFQKKENDLKFTFFIIHFNGKFEGLFEKFEKEFKDFLIKESSLNEFLLFKDYEINKGKLEMKFDSSVTRKKLEPYFKKYFEKENDN